MSSDNRLHHSRVNFKHLTIWLSITSLVGSLYSGFISAPKASADTLSQPTELQAYDTEYTNVYQNPDGTLSSKVYFAPVNYKDSMGNFKHIDTNLTPNAAGNLEAAKNRFDTTFASTSANALETIKYQGKQIQFLMAPDSMAPGLGSAVFSGLKGAKPQAHGNQALYSSIYPEVSLRETVSSLGVKEEFVLNKYIPGLHTFAFVLNTDGVTPKMNADGSIDFVDTTGNTVFFIPPGSMEDSNVDPHSGNAQSSKAVTYGLKQVGGKTILTVTADETWLADPSRVYPVYVDPPIYIKSNKTTDAYVSSAYSTTNYSGSKLWDSGMNAYDLKIGDYDSSTGDNWGYFQFPGTGQLPLLGLKVSSASFNAYCNWSYYSTTAEPTYLWANTATNWSPSTITWNSKPTHQSASMTSASVHKGQWAQFDVSTMIQDWSNIVSGEPYQNTLYPQEGFFLDEGGYGQDHWHKYIADESSSDQPYIQINYDAPSAPWGAMYTHDSNVSGTISNGYGNLWWNPVQGASSYNVKIWDGSKYEDYSTTPTNGNAGLQEWTSKGKGIWPTPSEVNSGVWQLHHDGSGAELAQDPSEVYHNANLANGGTDYTADHNYFFRIEAVTSDGQVSSVRQFCSVRYRLNDNWVRPPGCNVPHL